MSSEMRRRIFGSRIEDSRTPSPVTAHRKPSTDGSSDQHVSVPLKKLERLNSYVQEKRPKPSKRRTAWIFVLGGLVGLIGALAFAGQQDVIDFTALREMNLDNIMDALPAGLIRDAQKLQVSPSHMLFASRQLMMEAA